MDEKRDDIGSLLDKAFLMGLGAAAMTRERISELVDDLVERGRMSQTDAHKVADWVSQRASQQSENVRKIVSEETERTVSAAGVATRKDVERLEAELRDLKATLAAERGAPRDEHVP